jgi:hypothetical protein
MNNKELVEALRLKAEAADKSPRTQWTRGYVRGLYEAAKFVEQEGKHGNWRFLLTIPVGWRPPMDTYYAEMGVEDGPRDQHKVTTDGGVWIHPDANELAVRWALHLNLKAPREALGLPGVGSPP